MLRQQHVSTLPVVYVSLLFGQPAVLSASTSAEQATVTRETFARAINLNAKQP
jgi:hypothetical protein